MESVAFVQFVETEQPGSITEPPAATGAKGSSDAAYERIMFTPAGTTKIRLKEYSV